MADWFGGGRRMKGGSIGFDMFWSVDLSSVIGKVDDVVKDTTRTVARGVEDEAKRLAPVRRVVKGDRRGKTRALSVAERKSETEVRGKLGIRVGRAVVQTQAEDRRNRSVPSNPFLRAPGKRPPRSEPPELTMGGSGKFSVRSGQELSARGAYALKTGQAIRGPTVFGQGHPKAVAANRAKLRATNSAVYFQKSTASQITGGLKGGGRYTLGGRLRGEIYSEEATDGMVIKYWVISPTYYARYVEFGTRRSRAQPYLRPALARARRQFADTMRSNLRKLNWKPKRKHVRTRF